MIVQAPARKAGKRRIFECRPVAGCRPVWLRAGGDAEYGHHSDLQRLWPEIGLQRSRRCFHLDWPGGWKADEPTRALILAAGLYQFPVRVAGFRVAGKRPYIRDIGDLVRIAIDNAVL